jgi:hypothetical protein
MMVQVAVVTVKIMTVTYMTKRHSPWYNGDFVEWCSVLVEIGNQRVTRFMEGGHLVCVFIDNLGFLGRP